MAFFYREKVMKTRLLFITLACVFTFGCEKAKKVAVHDAWGDFAKSVLKAGNEKDTETFLNKLTFTTTADYKALIDSLKKANPPAKNDEKQVNPTDAELLKDAQADVRIFMNSYKDIFKGKLTSTITVQDLSIKGAKVYSMIIWTKHEDGKFRGIKIDSIWEREDGTIVVMNWAQLSGYYANKDVSIKMAVLERGSESACDYPDVIQYKYVFPNYSDRLW